MSKLPAFDGYQAFGAESEYVDDQDSVLINKLGITQLKPLLIKEEEGLVSCYQQMVKEIRFDTPLSCDLILDIHAAIFRELYPWAGQWRKTWISKGEMTWPNPEHIDRLMKQFEVDVLIPNSAPIALSDDQFCSAVALIQGEFLTIHPFREGNARTIKTLCDMYAVQTERPFLKYDDSERGKQQYISAAIGAFGKDYEPMKIIIDSALQAGRS